MDWKLSFDQIIRRHLNVSSNAFDFFSSGKIIRYFSKNFFRKIVFSSPLILSIFLLLTRFHSEPFLRQCKNSTFWRHHNIPLKFHVLSIIIVAAIECLQVICFVIWYKYLFWFFSSSLRDPTKDSPLHDLQGSFSWCHFKKIIWGNCCI